MKTLIKIVSYLVLVTGVCVGIYMLAAPAGAWLGAWDFRQGFSMLRKLHPYTSWIMYGCLAATLVVAGLAWSQQQPQKLKWVAVAAVGTVFATIAWMVPESFRPPADKTVPPIHDIATDTTNPLQFEAVLEKRGEGTNTVVYGGSPDMTPEKLAELQQVAYPQIQPQVYAQSPEFIFKCALTASKTLGWELVAQDAARGRIEATDTTFWFRFKDDIVIEVKAQDAGAVLNARSLSRVGVSDVGKNAARLDGLFAELARCR